MFNGDRTPPSRGGSADGLLRQLVEVLERGADFREQLVVHDAVAELALGLIISADRRIPDATAALRDGKWNKKGFGKAELQKVLVDNPRRLLAF